MLEHRTAPLLPRRDFYIRMAWSLGAAAALMGGCLALGVAGYHFIGGLAWIDALLNASMILSGMGPVDVLMTDAAKLFASFYALLSGVIFISTSGLLLAAPLHRLMHHFHLQTEDREEKPHKKR
ncbi:MAG: hypothetical protein K8S99_04355 [Planctomycetes bacterium]|nr:hypothetical protein [Planctomycetota bacterium]